jgi:hypothetical protein
VKELPATTENTLACSMVDGYSTLAQIGQRLAAAQGWDADRGYLHARGVFFALARRGVCLPANPLEE